MDIKALKIYVICEMQSDLKKFYFFIILYYYASFNIELKYILQFSRYRYALAVLGILLYKAKKNAAI